MCRDFICNGGEHEARDPVPATWFGNIFKNQGRCLGKLVWWNVIWSSRRKGLVSREQRDNEAWNVL